MPIIDTHAHIFPGDFGPAPAGCDPAGWPAVTDGPDESTRLLVNGPMRFPAKKVWFDAEARLEASAASGLDAELLSPFPALLSYRAPAKTGLTCAGSPTSTSRAWSPPTRPGSTGSARSRCRTRSWPRPS